MHPHPCPGGVISSLCFTAALALVSGFASVARAADTIPASSATLTTSPGPTPTLAAPAAPGNDPAANRTTPPSSSGVENTVVKIFATLLRPDPYKPWTKSAPIDVTGSGVIIEGKRILTNAHVVLYASQVQVQANQAGDKVSATVEYIAPGIDLAVLKLDDDSFFDNRPPILRTNALPDIKDSVLAYGYPTGGTSLSITKGIVSRIEFTGYNFSTAGLRVQIDAAINPGNSGGPAIVGDKMIGLAFSHLGGAENIGYIIPTEEINLFLADIADGKYDGKPAMFDEWQTLENPALRSYLELPKGTHGVVVHRPYSDEPGYPLKEWDVITKIDNTPIDDQGMVRLREDLRVRFQYLIQKVARDGKVPLTIVRAGRVQQVELPVFADRSFVLPALRGSYPSYFVFGPMVFSDATADFIDGVDGNVNVLRLFSFMSNPLLTRRGDRPAFPGERLVVVSSPFFPHKLSKGYDNPMGRVIDSVNGKHVNNLASLVQMLRDSKDAYVTIRFAGRGSEAIVLPRKESIAAMDEILTDNGVRAQGSPDMLAIWNAKPAAASPAPVSH
ncbi:MAG TPA: trypsin-like peptidase domain-containing protein [Opitutaceae bacterium]|nr:trypsin-like peptidase domain-containing protein [Opitutaceae bacterium]